MTKWLIILGIILMRTIDGKPVKMIKTSLRYIRSLSQEHNQH